MTGGEEFVIIMPETSLHAATILAERLRKKIDLLKIPSAKKSFSFTVSIGVATWNKTDLDIDSIINRADEYLYKAKENGRNQVAAENMS